MAAMNRSPEMHLCWATKKVLNHSIYLIPQLFPSGENAPPPREIFIRLHFFLLFVERKGVDSIVFSNVGLVFTHHAPSSYDIGIVILLELNLWTGYKLLFQKKIAHFYQHGRSEGWFSPGKGGWGHNKETGMVMRRLGQFPKDWEPPIHC